MTTTPMSFLGATHVVCGSYSPRPMTKNDELLRFHCFLAEYVQKLRCRVSAQRDSQARVERERAREKDRKKERKSELKLCLELLGFGVH